MNLVIGNNSFTKRDVVDPNKTIIQLCDEFGVDYTHGATMLNGVTLSPAQMEMSLVELGCRETCSIFNLAKLNNA